MDVQWRRDELAGGGSCYVVELFGYPVCKSHRVTLSSVVTASSTSVEKASE